MGLEKEEPSSSHIFFIIGTLYLHPELHYLGTEVCPLSNFFLPV
jgi:hypothetical protein